MANSTSHFDLPYPIRKARFSVEIPYLDADGDPTDPTTPDTEISKDAGAFADCAEEVTTITGSNGAGYLTLTGAEMDCALAFLAAKVASGPKNTLASLRPRNLPIVTSGTLSAGSAGGGTLQSAIGYDLTGCIIRTTGGTGGGGTGGANNQARVIASYTKSTGAFTITTNWETTVSTDTTYDVLLPDGMTLGMLKALNPVTAGRELVVDAAGLADANTVKVGPTGSGTAQTAGDIPARLPSALTANGNMKSSVLEWISTVFTEGATGRMAAAIQGMFNVTSPVLTAQSVNQTGDNYARTGAPVGASISADIAAAKANLVTILASIGTWTGTGVNTVLGAFKAIMRKDASLPSDIGGTYDPATDSLEFLQEDGADLRDFGIMNATTIASLASQVSFTLTAGSADDDAYNGCPVVVTDQSTNTQKCIGYVDDYTGSTKTVTLRYDPGIFTMATGDYVTIMPRTTSPAVKRGKALSNFAFFMVDSSDDVSGKTGLTITAERMIDGGSFAACTNSAAEVANGVYKINLSASDLAGGVIVLKFTGTGANATILTLVTDP